MAITLASTSDPSYPTYPLLASSSIILTLLPAYWHFKSRNVGTCVYILWVLIGNIVFLVDSAIWNGNMQNGPPGWCDLVTKLMIGMSAGMPTASMIINRKLYKIATIRQVNISKGESRRNAIIEFGLGFGIPIVIMILHVIPQGHRYDILEGIGCWPSTYITPMAIVCVLMWPIILGLVSLFYATLSIKAFLKQRKQFSALLQSANTGLDASRYFRLMALAATEICFSLPFSIFMLASDLKVTLHPWLGWADTHYNFNRVEHYPFGYFALSSESWILVNVTRYAPVAGGWFFFAYLGLSGESGVFYRKQFWRVAGLVGLSPSTSVSPMSSWAGRSQPSRPRFVSSNIQHLGTTASMSSSVAEKPEYKSSEKFDSLSLDLEYAGKDTTHDSEHEPTREHVSDDSCSSSGSQISEDAV